RKTATYIVKYYKDEIDSNDETKNYVGEGTPHTAEVGTPIRLVSGDQDSQLNYKKNALDNPDYYLDGVQQGDVPYTMKESTYKEDGTPIPQVIKVLYARKTATYIVKYYKDEIDPNDETKNYVGESDVYPAYVGEEIRLSEGDQDAQLNNKKTRDALNDNPDYYLDGVQQNPVPYVMKESTYNQDGTPVPQVIKVLYAHKTTSYRIEYYKGKELDGAAHIEDVQVTDGNAGDVIEEKDINLNAKKPAGHKNGEWIVPTVDGAKKLVLDVDSENNVIKVLYRPIKVTVKIEGKQVVTQYNGKEQSTDDDDFYNEEFPNGYRVTVVPEQGYESECSVTDGQIGLAEGAKAEAHGTEVNDSRNSEYPDYYPMNLHGTPVNPGDPACSFVCNNPNGEDVTFELVEDGWLKITPVEDWVVVTIQGKQVTTTYNGEEQNTNMFNVDGFEPGKGYRVVSIKYEDGRDVVGLTADDIALVEPGTDIAKGTEANTPANIEYPEHYPMNLRGTPGTSDGSEVSDGNAEVTDGNAEDQTCSFKNTNDRFLDVKFVVEDGWLKINPSNEKIVVTITGNNNTVYYNGKEQSVKGYTVDSITKDGKPFDKITKENIVLVKEGTDVASGTNVKRTATKAIDKYMMNLHGTPTETDTAECSFKCINSDFNDVTFIVHDGYLVINPLKLTVNVVGNRGEEVYDGTEKKVTGYTLNLDSTVSDGNAEVTDGNADVSGGNAGTTPDASKFFDEGKVVFTGEAVAKGVLPDTYPMGLTKDQFSYSDENIDVDFVVVDGQLIIKDRPETDKLHVVAKTPDRTEMFSGKTWVGTDFDYTVEGSVIVLNPLTKALNAIGDVFGKLFGLNANAANTGKEIEIKGNKYTVSGLRVDVTARNVGQYDLVIVNEGFKVVDAAGNDVTAQFDDPELINGKFTITPKPIELKSDSASKVYDGTPLVSHHASASDSWGIGDAVTYNFTGSQTDPGSSENKFNAVEATALTDFRNYTITYVFGTLTVTASSDSENPPKKDDTPNVTPPKGDDNPPVDNPEKENKKKNKKTDTPPTQYDDSNNDNNDSAVNNTTPADQRQVLGAKREQGEQPGVLGARRGGTEDNTNTSRIFVLLIAAGAAATLLALGKKRKKNDEQ
ncbi:hypothetical protein, partial [Butyrivibrio sp. WCE2006]